MNYRIAINGFGRIGRNYLRALLDRNLLDEGYEIVAVNDLWELATLAHLLAYDSTFGPLDAEVTLEGTAIVVDGRRIATFREREPELLPWAQVGVDLVIEATGKLRTRDAAAGHLKAGAQRVLISAPGKEVDATIVLGVNDAEYDPWQQVISAASCTTNCAAPMVKVLQDAFGLSRGYLTTVHAYTNDQAVLDTPHKDLRRARAAAVNKDKTHSEFHYGSFYRSVPVPAGAREDTFSAEYTDGILTIKVLVGEAGTTGKPIPITVGAATKK